MADTLLGSLSRGLAGGIAGALAGGLAGSLAGSRAGLRAGVRPVERLTARARWALAHGRQVALLHVDLDRGPALDDLCGLAVAEHVRRTVTRRVRAAVGSNGHVARGGGVLLVLVDRLDGPEQADLLADRVLSAVRAPLDTVECDGAPVAVLLTASAGLALGRAGDSVVDVLMSAAAASARARVLGGDRLLSADPGMHAEAVARARVERLLRRALPEERLRLVYQPIVDLDSGQVLGAEALLRLVDDDGSLLPPSEFVAVAEQTDLVVDLGTWVLREACRQLFRWQVTSPLPLTMSVNCSARQVACPDFADVVLAAAFDAGVPPSALVLELTETALLEATPQTLGHLQRLRRLGVAVGVDDFGTGWSSLRSLRDLPVSFLKVDRSFVAGMTVEHADSVVVGAVVALARELGLDCVAEGIETPDQLIALQALGAPTGQGFLLSRPVDAAGLPGVLQRRLIPDPVIQLPPSQPLGPLLAFPRTDERRG